MPLDPQAKAIIEERARLGAPALNTLTPKEARANAATRPVSAGPDVGHVENRTISGPAGEIPVRIYTPAVGAGPFPAFVYFHGGGWVIGTLDMSDGRCRNFRVDGGCVVVTVD